MKVLANLGTTETGRTILLLGYDNSDITQIVLCSNYDPTRPDGQKWDFGHYFENVITLSRYLNSRTEELATNALHYISDMDGDLSNFEEDFSDELTEDEKEFFGF